MKVHDAEVDSGAYKIKTNMASKRYSEMQSDAI